jgi:hypothetical protein
MKRILALLALVASLAVVGAASGQIVDEETSSVGDGQTASVTLLDVSRTTAFAVGVWSSLEVAAPVTGEYSVTCANPANNRSGPISLIAGRFVSDAQYIWVGSPAVASPWYGWDTCSVAVTLRQGGAEDHSLIAWLASHNGNA